MGAISTGEMDEIQVQLFQPQSEEMVGQCCAEIEYLIQTHGDGFVYTPRSVFCGNVEIGPAFEQSAQSNVPGIARGPLDPLCLSVAPTPSFACTESWDRVDPMSCGSNQRIRYGKLRRCERNQSQGPAPRILQRSKVVLVTDR